MQNRKVRQAVPAPEFDMTSVSRGAFATNNGEGQLRNTPPNMDDVLGVSEMLGNQPNNDNGHNHGPNHSEGSYQSAYEAGLANGREAGCRQGYREGFLDGYKVRNSVRAIAPTPDKMKIGSNKAAAKSVTRLRGLPCANCGRTTYSDELECSGCGTSKADAAREKVARAR